MCGMSEIDITPPLGLSMPGYWLDRKATGIKDILYAKAMVLDNGSHIAAFITLDVMAIERNDVNLIRKRVSELCDIPETGIMVSATHTHTGGPILGGYASEADGEYICWLIKKAADAAVIAYDNRKPARIGFGLGSERDIAFNRRYFMKDGSVRTNPGVRNPMIDYPAGPIDPDVTVMRIDDLDERPIGVITNYACHLDVVGGTEYSADYPGVLSGILKKVLGWNIVSMFFTGTCGDINHTDVCNGIRKDGLHYKRMGTILAGEVLKTREKISTDDNICLGANQSVLMINTRKPSKEDLRKAEEALRISDGKADINYAKELLKAGQMTGDKAETEIQVIRIGDLAVTGLPGEIFVEFGIDIKKGSPLKYNMINELANSSNGYIPTREAFARGGYETRLTSYSRLVPEAGYILVEKALELINELKEE